VRKKAPLPKRKQLAQGQFLVPLSRLRERAGVREERGWGEGTAKALMHGMTARGKNIHG